MLGAGGFDVVFGPAILHDHVGLDLGAGLDRFFDANRAKPIEHERLIGCNHGRPRASIDQV